MIQSPKPAVRLRPFSRRAVESNQDQEDPLFRNGPWGKEDDSWVKEDPLFINDPWGKASMGGGGTGAMQIQTERVPSSVKACQSPVSHIGFNPLRSEQYARLVTPGVWPLVKPFNPKAKTAKTIRFWMVLEKRTAKTNGFGWFWTVLETFFLFYHRVLYVPTIYDQPFLPLSKTGPRAEGRVSITGSRSFSWGVRWFCCSFCWSCMVFQSFSMVFL